MRTLVYDLDGTLCKINTYKLYIMLLMPFCIITLQVSSFVKLLKIVFNRLRKKITRWEMKRQIGLVYSTLDRSRFFETVLIELLVLFTNRQILERHFKPGDVKILATAAYSFYAKKIGDRFNFDQVIATTVEDLVDNVECIGEEKLSRLKSAIKDSKMDVFFTDHRDDIPSMHLAKVTYLVRPSRRTLEEIRPLKLNVNYDYA